MSDLPTKLRQLADMSDDGTAELLDIVAEELEWAEEELATEDDF